MAIHSLAEAQAFGVLLIPEDAPLLFPFVPLAD